MYDKINLAILVSGSGTNLQAIIDGINCGIINAQICVVVSNRKNAYALERAKTHNLPTIYEPYISMKKSIPPTPMPQKLSQEKREEYDLNLALKIREYNPDIIVLAGWMHILSQNFIDNFEHIINLHPALPGQFPGKDSILDAYDSAQKGFTNYTGVMCHRVVEKIDAGETLSQAIIPIFKNDTFEDLKSRLTKAEKGVLIQGLLKIINNLSDKYKTNLIDTLNKDNIENLIAHKIECGDFYDGKVRKVIQLDDENSDILALYHTNKLSSFDRFICNIEGKGKCLVKSSTWWFNQTKHIVPNHHIYSKENIMIVKKCIPFSIEFVVRGYITGNTNTSLWTHYNNGVRNYCGIDLPEGLVKNQKLPRPLITPTTKGEKDELISPSEIISNNYLSENQWNYISKTALKLFEYGQKLALEKGLILVDTKYEFGLDKYQNIILIDEIHTCDSSRYWIAETYLDRFNNNLEPEKIDKDMVRDYVKNICNPYTDTIPEIPTEKIKQVSNSYSFFAKKFI